MSEDGFTDWLHEPYTRKLLVYLEERKFAATEEALNHLANGEYANAQAAAMRRRELETITDALETESWVK